MGEAPGKLYDSGLLLLSDYPVTRVRRMAYPRFACAGLDCMANKGALLVTVELPGAPAPVDVVVTHLNSRHSSRVPDTRSLYAYQRQVELLSQFVEANRDPGHPLIVAGDFNVGKAPARGAALLAQVPGWGEGSPVTESFGALAAQRRALGEATTPGADAVIRRNTDFEFIAPGKEAELVPLGANVQFGTEPWGGMLSDHIGYTVTFAMKREPTGLAAAGPVTKPRTDSPVIPAKAGIQSQMGHRV